MNLVNTYCFDNLKKQNINDNKNEKKIKKISERKLRKMKHTHICKKLMSNMYKQFVTITVLIIEFGIYSTKTS